MFAGSLRLRESGLRDRCPVVGPILKQRHGIAHVVVGGFTHGNTSFLVMNPDFQFVLAMDVIVCTAGEGDGLRTSRTTEGCIEVDRRVVLR